MQALLIQPRMKPAVHGDSHHAGLLGPAREKRPQARKELEEERRLAYVAFTRAMDRLVLTSARVRRKWAELKITRPSRFLAEIPEHCLAVRRQKIDIPPPSSFRRRSGTSPGAASSVSTSFGQDDFDQSVHYEEFPEYSVDDEVDYDQSMRSVAIASGMAVRHSSFGMGRVVSTKGQGEGKKLVIDFATVGLKTVLSRFVEIAVT